MSFNQSILQGRLTGDPTFKTTNSGKSVCEFTIAVNRRFDRETTDFFNCTAWNGTADFIAKYFKKGQEILVSGEMHIDKWEKDGIKFSAPKLQIEQASFCGGKSENNSADKFVELDDDDELPFG